MFKIIIYEKIVKHFLDNIYQLQGLFNNIILNCQFQFISSF